MCVSTVPLGACLVVGAFIIGTVGCGAGGQDDRQRVPYRVPKPDTGGTTEQPPTPKDMPGGGRSFDAPHTKGKP
jgi:hypothetical protein